MKVSQSVREFDAMWEMGIDSKLGRFGENGPIATAPFPHFGVGL